jgi:hypothetical protein
MMLKMLDDMLRDIVPDGWKNVGTEKRSVLFECGYVHFKRRIYQDTEGARHKPLDELLELEPWQRNSRALEEMSSALAATNTYRKASSLLSWLVKAAIKSQHHRKISEKNRAENTGTGTHGNRR